MHLTDLDEAMLAGDYGHAAALAMDLVVASGTALGAEQLIDIKAAHIDGCLYHGQAGLDFARALVEGGGVVRVPTTLNVTSLDLLHPELFRGSDETAEAAQQLIASYVDLGCQPTWTCAPYQLSSVPSFGDQVAWGESNAIVFANSVIGARTNRYGDFMDICCALIGRAPYSGLHTDEGRLAKIVVHLDLDDSVLDSDLVYVLIGHVLGQRVGSEVAVIDGFDPRADNDRLKAVGAAAASSGSVAMFHAAGVTPEAPTVSAATGDGTPQNVFRITNDDLRAAHIELTTGEGQLAAVSVGTPHMSLSEMRELSRLAAGRVSRVPFYLNTSRAVLNEAESEGITAVLEGFGATVVTDTCTYITPIMTAVDGDVMTNSGKWAYYAPANLGVGVRIGSLADCVESAELGSVISTETWL